VDQRLYIGRNLIAMRREPVRESRRIRRAELHGLVGSDDLLMNDRDATATRATFTARAAGPDGAARARRRRIAVHRRATERRRPNRHARELVERLEQVVRREVDVDLTVNRQDPRELL